MEEQKKKTLKSPLEKRKVKVTPILRDGRWLQGNHDGAFQYTGTQTGYDLPYDLHARQRREPFTNEERLWLESPESGLALSSGALSVHKKEDSYWDSFRVNIDKTGLILDLNNAMDFMRYKLLLANIDKIAPNWDARFDLGTYRFALVDENFEIIEKAKKSTTMQEIYMFFGEITNSNERMKDFLMIYGLEKRDEKNVKVPSDASIDFLKAEIQKIIDNDQKGFTALMKDKSYEHRAMIVHAIRRKAVTYGKDGYKITSSGKTIGKTMDKAIEYLMDDLNNEDLFIVTSQIEKSK